SRGLSGIVVPAHRGEKCDDDAHDRHQRHDRHPTRPPTPTPPNPPGPAGPPPRGPPPGPPPPPGPAAPPPPPRGRARPGPRPPPPPAPPSATPPTRPPHLPRSDQFQQVSPLGARHQARGGRRIQRPGLPRRGAVVGQDAGAARRRPGVADAAPVEDDAVARVRPSGPRQQPRDLALDAHRVGGVGPPPPVHQPHEVRVH